MADDQAPDTGTGLPDSMQDVLSAQSAIQQNSGTQQGPNPGVAQQPPSNQLSAPLLARFIGQMIQPSAQGPTSQQPANISQGPARPNRTDAFHGFIGQFISNLAAGLANQGSGPASFGRGFGAAVENPLVQARQQFALQQQAQAQQADIAQKQAQAELERSQAGMVAVRDPNGQTLFLPGKEAASYLAAQTRAGATSGAAESRAGAAVKVAQIGAASREKVAAMSDQVRKDIAQGQLGVAQARVKYMGMDTASKSAYRQSIVNNLQFLAQQKAQATAAMATKNTAEAQKALNDANNKFSMMAYLAQSVGIKDEDAGVPLAQQPTPQALPIQPVGTPQTPQGGGAMQFARDPQGKLHQAPVGTPLPKGWKLGQ